MLYVQYHSIPCDVIPLHVTLHIVLRAGRENYPDIALWLSKKVKNSESP